MLPTLASRRSLWCLAFATACASAATPPSDPSPRVLSLWRMERGDMPLAVIEAAAIASRGRVHLLGGVDRSFEATAAIQTFTRRDGWRPIGDRLAIPRAGASGLPLPDGRLLVLGGFEGDVAAPHWHDDGEVLDPTIAGSAERLASFGESLEGHSATPLADGRVLVVAGTTARCLDPSPGSTPRWGPPTRLPAARRGHVAVRLDDRRVLVACGLRASETEAPALRILELPEDPAEPPRIADAIDEGRSEPLRVRRDVAGARDPTSGWILLAGGVDPDTSRSAAETWWFSPEDRLVRSGPRLPPGGATRLHLVPVDGGIAILGGEWRRIDGRGPADLALLARGGEADAPFGRLAPLPVSGSRRMRIVGDGVDLIGGYRYRSPTEAETFGLPAGVHFDDRRYRLSLAPVDGGD